MSKGPEAHVGAGRAGDGGIWSRDFGLFFAARAVAKLGDTMLPVALAAGLLQHGHGAGAVGLAMAATTVCFAVPAINGLVRADVPTLSGPPPSSRSARSFRSRAVGRAGSESGR